LFVACGFFARSRPGTITLVIPWLARNASFPPIEDALADPNGLLAAGGDLSAKRLVAAYSQGIFPWFSEGQPILWWSPDPRMVLFVDELKVSRSLGKAVRRGTFELRTDTAFAQVMAACAAPRPDQHGTWIGPAMREAYGRLHRLGYAHSVESWQDGELVGGLYGIMIGRAFFGESMFARATDASKVALVRLVAILRTLGVPLIDCQQETGHLASLGARPIPRAEFAAWLGRLVHSGNPPAHWHYTAADLQTAARHRTP
jgi:leucyl/phenylalanyl-tRNA--protein transferase